MNAETQSVTEQLDALYAEARGVDPSNPLVPFYDAWPAISDELAAVQDDAHNFRQRLNQLRDEARRELERAEARVAELEGELAAWRAECDKVHIPYDPEGLVRHHRNEAGFIVACKLDTAEADRDAALDLLRRWKVVGDVLFYIAPAPVVRDTDAFLARVDSEGEQR